MINLKINPKICEKIETWEEKRDLKLQDTTTSLLVYFLENQNLIVLTLSFYIRILVFYIL